MRNIIREKLLPDIYIGRLHSFEESYRQNKSFYNYQGITYQITEKQVFCYQLFRSYIIICGLIAGVCGKINLINVFISVFIRALIGTVIGIFVGVVALRLFIKKSDKNISHS